MADVLSPYYWPIIMHIEKMLDTIHINYMLILMPKIRHLLQMKKINRASERKAGKK